MSLSFLELHNLRNIVHTQLEPSQKLNLVFGSNASGKTSLLEAIHLLGLARSFRSHAAGSFIQKGHAKTTIYGKYQAQEKATTIGFEKSRQKTELKLNGERLQQVSEIAKALPLQILGPESHALVDAGPSIKRRFIDWGVFHVEHNYIEIWKKYRRILRQRNTALRKNPSTAPSWDKELAKCAEEIDTLRVEYLKKLKPRFLDNLEQITDLKELKVSYRRGWQKDKSLSEQLKLSFTKDKQTGYTGCGPHRADLRLEVDGAPVDQILSRGQQKLVVYALKIAQASLFSLERRCLFLIDDLQAELDAQHRKKVLQLLASTNSQVFITATDKNILDLSVWGEHKMFHVEHGNFKEVV